jgi:hypothetical protein
MGGKFFTVKQRPCLELRWVTARCGERAAVQRTVDEREGRRSGESRRLQDVW